MFALRYTLDVAGRKKKKKKDREESYFIDEKRVEFVKIMQKN